MFAKHTNVALAIGSIVSSIVGAILLGHIAFTIMHAILGLDHAPFSSLILPGIIVTVSLIFGTIVLVYAVQMEHKVWKTWLVLLNTVFSSLVLIVDMGIRTFIFFADLLSQL